VEYIGVGVAVFSRKSAISLKRSKIASAVNLDDMLKNEAIMFDV